MCGAVVVRWWCVVVRACVRACVRVQVRTRLRVRAWQRYLDLDHRDDDPAVDTRGAGRLDDDGHVDWDLTCLVSYRPAT